MRKPSQARSQISDTRELINSRLDSLQVIVDTLEANGVSDEYFKSSPLYDHAPAYKLAASLERAKEEDIKEAIDLCNILNSIDKPSRWRFRRKPTDETTKALLSRLSSLYYSIAG